MKNFMAILMAMLFLLGMIVEAQAALITAEDIKNGGISGLFTSSALGGSFALKAMCGSGDAYYKQDVVGIKSGEVSGEIDLDGESITITFTKPFILSDLELGLLFKSGNRSDTVNEKAKIVADGIAFYFEVTDSTTASWTGSGSVNNLSPGLNGYNGLWQISNPFGDTPVSKLEFYAVQQGQGGAADSDFGIYQVQGAVVPIPSTILLLGSGLIGAFGLRKIKKGWKRNEKTS
ncbi:hypothetical protein DMNBHIDG_02354 [Candidatus Methanoperedenaceae archaeon GB37]|nr:hypothetical protein DMNBHIDG_02354 [Candidatus Methanoperedenaceae archaeon GB37]